MKILRVSSTLALKTLRRRSVQNGVSPRNVMIRGFAAAGSLESESGSNTMIAAKKKVGEVSGLLKAMTEKGVEPNLVSLNTVIQGLIRERRPREAEEVFEEMRRKGLAPNETTYTSLIDLFCDSASDFSGKPYWSEKADKVLSEMIDGGFSPSVATYNNLIHACCRERRVEEAVEFFRGMAEKGLAPDAVSYSNVISGFCRIPNLEKAFEMKKEMVEKGFLPDAAAYSSLIRMHLFCGYSQPRLSEAFDLLREMLCGGVLLDVDIYFTLMNAYCEKGEFSKAFHLYDEMIHKGFHLHDEMIHKDYLYDIVTGFSPSLVTCNAFIHGLCFLGRVEEALGILRGMAEMGLSPDNVSYTTVVSGFCRIRELRKAYDLKLEMDEMMLSDMLDIMPLSGTAYYSLMEEEGALLDEVNYTSLINAYCADGEVSKACEFRDHISHYACTRDSVTYSVLINGLDKKARTKEAKEMLLSLFYSLCCRSYLPLTYDTLIENCSNNEFKSVVELVKGFRMGGLENEADSVLNTLLQWNYKPDGPVYNLLIVEHCRRRNVDKAYNMYMEIMHYGFALHMFSVLALIKVLYYDGRYNETSWVIENTLRSCNLNDSELHKVLHEIDVRKGIFKEDALLNVLAEIAMDGLLFNGGKCLYAPACA